MKKILNTKQTHENGVYEYERSIIKKINWCFENKCFEDGDRYEGEYYEDDTPVLLDGYLYDRDKLGVPDKVIPHGKGTYSHCYNSRILFTFVGEFRNGHKHGLGRLTSGNEEKGYWEGEWKGGSFYDGNIFDKDGNITGKFVKGEEQNER
jgi:hypothetical protein